MRGYLGKAKNHDEDQRPEVVPGPQPYDLIYILDAIYHFPPSVPYFLSTALSALRPGSGVLVYTDILPPPDLSAAMGHLILPPLLGVPARNLVQRPKSLVEYKAKLEKLGYEDVTVEDWSEGVWEGFGRNLRGRGWIWGMAGRAIDAAARSKWRFVGIRARRPLQMT